MTTDSARLARIASATGADPGDVRIYEIDKGYSTWVWLCPKHRELSKLLGYEVKQEKPAPHKLTCDWRNRGACS